MFIRINWLIGEWWYVNQTYLDYEATDVDARWCQTLPNH
jgi:hypothetical protein